MSYKKYFFLPPVSQKQIINTPSVKHAKNIIRNYECDLPDCPSKFTKFQENDIKHNDEGKYLTNPHYIAEIYTVPLKLYENEKN